MERLKAGVWPTAHLAASACFWPLGVKLSPARALRYSRFLQAEDDSSSSLRPTAKLGVESAAKLLFSREALDREASRHRETDASGPGRQAASLPGRLMTT